MNPHDSYVGFRPLADAPIEGGGHGYIAWKRDDRILVDHGLTTEDSMRSLATERGMEFRLEEVATK